VKGEAAALSVRAQRCQSHYFSTAPCMSAGGHSAQNLLNHGEELLFSPPNFLTELQNTLCHAVKTENKKNKKKSTMFQHM
jgi:hypothetical protein